MHRPPSGVTSYVGLGRRKYIFSRSPSIKDDQCFSCCISLVTFSRKSFHEPIAAVVHAPIQPLPNLHLLDTEMAACQINIKKKEGERGEPEVVVEFPPDAPGPPLDNALRQLW